ncbi:MAG TPA: lysophospholipid acyltransferase family protein [Kofleriaceae bacterium]|nr:lysophospholipid acyltransferase family protein [Kofleriaceae bacterium]
MVEPVSTPRDVAPAAHEPPASELTRLEKLAIRLAEATNETAAGKRFQDVLLRRVSYVWVRAILANRCIFEGLPEVLALRPERGVLIASNHRSFFDQYAILLGLYLTGAPWCERINFPVRANFFYEHPLGVMVNLLAAGGAMYPPVFRQRERAAENKRMVEKLVDKLGERGTVIGVHPEGTRGKGPDPYEMLPAQPGIGQIALQARPLVIPAMVQGLSNDFVGDARLNFRADARRVRPVTVVFGAPIDYSEFLAQKPRPTLYKKTADLMRQKILELVPREQELRRQCLAGEISDDDPRWLTNYPHDPLNARIRPL